MLIYANGDSFTAGVGINDYLMFPNDYPGNNRAGETYNPNLQAAWSRKRLNLINELNCHDELDTKNRERAYPSHVRNMLGATQVINGAQGGSSMFGIYYRTVHDITKLLDQGTAPGLTIIGLTAPERLYCFEREQAKENDYQSWVINIMPNTIKNSESRYKKYAQEYWNSHNDEELLTTFLYQCLAIKSFVKSTTGKFPLFLNTSSVFYRYTDLIQESKLPILQEIWKILNFDVVVNKHAFYYFGKTNLITACGHYEEKTHFQYAKYIVDDLLLTNEQDVL